MDLASMTGIAYRGAAAFALAVLWISSAAAAGEPLSLDQAVEIALKSSPGLKAADSQVAAAEAGLLKSRSGFLPKVTLSETWSRSDNPLMVLGTKLNRESVTQADFDPAVMNAPDALSNYTTRLQVMQPVFNGGKEYLGLRQARLAASAAGMDRNRTRQETVFSVVKAYYGVLLAKEYLTVATQSLGTSTANVRLAEARFRAGAVLQSDLLRARVQEAEVKEMLTRAESGVKLAAANLNYVMGVELDREYAIDGALSGRDQLPALDQSVRSAIEHRPDLAALDLNRRNAEAGVRQARTEFVPTLNVVGQADWNSDRPAGDDAKSWAVMAVLQWNIFDGLATTSNVRQASAAAGRMRHLEEQMKAGVQLQVKQAFYNLQASLDRIHATRSSVQEAEEGLRMVQKRYEAGMTTLVDVLNAESALIRTRTNALHALYDNSVADAELKLATGTL